MPVIPKSKTIQLRVTPELFDKFSEEVAYYGDATVSAVLRGMMHKFIREMQHRRERLAKDAEWAATLESRRQAALAAQAAEKQRVEPVNKPMSLSEKRKAEKAAKEARKARKEDRY